MNKKMKNYILDAYDFPKPKHKEEFMASINYPKTRWYDFTVSQFGYIRKRIWIISLLLFLAGILLGTLWRHGDTKLLWLTSAIFPYVAVLSITEVARSAAFGLAELEMTTRYSLRSVLYARMAIMGVGNLLLLIAIIPILVVNLDINIIKIGIYLLVPYLLTSFLSYMIVNRIRSKDFSYYCAATAAAISLGGLILGQIWEVIYKQQYFILWFVASILLAVALMKEMKKLINQSEEMLWNSYSTV